MSTQLNTIFRWCNDVDAMRHFYSHCLQLQETFYQNDVEHGWLTYQLGDIQLVFSRADETLPQTAVFAQNPAYQGGEALETSWAIQLAAPMFDIAVQRLQAAHTPAYSPPFSNRPHHLQYIVRDPMGMTVEIYTVRQ